MTKRKLLAIIIAVAITCTFCACAKTEEKTESAATFVVVGEGSIINSGGIHQYIMYDPETFVMYTFLDGYKCGAPTVMYNADGTPKLYSPEN